MARLRPLLLLSALAYCGDADPGALLQRARLLAEKNQNLTEAVRLYGEVIRLAQAQHSLAARARYEQGLLYLRLGKGVDAQAAFRAVVRDFPLQTAVAAMARARLPAEKLEIAMRRVWSGEEADPHGLVSPDGRFLSFVDWSTGDLAIRTLNSGQNRRVTRKGKSWANSSAGALESVFSPDGRHLAYSWLDEQGHKEIRVTGVD